MSIKINKNNKYKKKKCNCNLQHTIDFEFNGQQVSYKFKNEGVYHKFVDALKDGYYMPNDVNNANDVNGANKKNIDYVNKILGIIRDKLRKQSVGVRGEQEPQTSVSAKKLPQSEDVSDADGTKLSVDKEEETQKKDDIKKLEKSLKHTKEYKNFTGILKSTDTGLYYLCKEGKIHTANLYRFKREGLKKKLNGEGYEKTPFINYLRRSNWSYPSAIQKKYKDLYREYSLVYLQKAGPRIKVDDAGEEIRGGDVRTTFGTFSLLNDEQKFRMYFKSETTSTQTMSDMSKSGQHEFELIHKTVEMTAREIRNNLQLRLSNGVPVDNIIEYEKANVQPKSYDLSTKIYFEKANKITYASNPPTYQEIKNYDITATEKEDANIRKIMNKDASLRSEFKIIPAQFKDNMRVTIPAFSKFEKFINKYSKKFGIEPELVKAIITAESGGKIKAKSNKGALGLMQIIQSTFDSMTNSTRFKNRERTDPEANIYAGCKYISQLSKKSWINGNIVLIVGAYNAGPGNLKSSYDSGYNIFINRKPNKNKDRYNYISKIISAYKELGGKESIDLNTKNNKYVSKLKVKKETKKKKQQSNNAPKNKKVVPVPEKGPLPPQLKPVKKQST
jgi:soluble lytic murein transglycosylase